MNVVQYYILRKNVHKITGVKRAGICLPLPQPQPPQTPKFFRTPTTNLAKI